MRFALRVTLVAASLGWAALLASGAARAQAPAQDDAKVAQARENARALALKALAKIDGGQPAEGIALLEQAEAAFHAPTHLLYLAQAHAAMGHAALAAQTYDTLVREELPNYAPDEFREAERIGKVELSAIQSRVGRIKLVLVGTPDATTPTVKLDDVPRKVAADIVFVEPGAHEIAVAVGREVRRARATVTAGSEAPLVFDFGGIRPRVRDGEVGFAAPAPDGPAPFVIPGAVLLSVGGAALIAGGITGALSFREVDELSDRCPERVGCDPADREIADSARLLGNVSTAMFVIGGLAAATGVVLVAIPGPGPTTPNVRARVGPAFLGLEGSF